MTWLIQKYENHGAGEEERNWLSGDAFLIIIAGRLVNLRMSGSHCREILSNITPNAAVLSLCL